MDHASPFMSSAQAAALLGVGASSIKRWADEGTLSCLKTAGRHRRFAREEVERLRDAQAAGVPERMAADVEAWLRALAASVPPQALEARLLEARSQAGAWWRVAESLGPVLEELGRRWARRRLTVVDEHLASERLARALQRVGEWLPSSAAAPRALLTVVEGDEHTLGLSLVELCLRERGWTTLWTGRRTPTESLGDATEACAAQYLLVSASCASSNPRRMRAIAERLERECKPRGVALVLGGRGAWPSSLRYARVLRRLGDLDGWLAGR